MFLSCDTVQHISITDSQMFLSCDTQFNISVTDSQMFLSCHTTQHLYYTMTARCFCPVAQFNIYSLPLTAKHFHPVTQHLQCHLPDVFVLSVLSDMSHLYYSQPEAFVHQTNQRPIWKSSEVAVSFSFPNSFGGM